MSHYLKAELASAKRITIVLVGCGGNGAAMLTGLARLDHALRETGRPGLMVATFDDDIVTRSNIGRQPFYVNDIGRSKAVVLTERINHAYGLDWQAVPARVRSDGIRGEFHVLITCIDTAKGRRVIANSLKHKKILPQGYWLDLGNRATDGQIVLGTTRKGPRQWLRLGDQTHPTRLPTVVERFPELMEREFVEDDAPSCSLAEALEKQSLFINQTLASHALAMLWELLGKGRIEHAGLFVNLATGSAAPMPLPKYEAPKRRLRQKADPAPARAIAPMASAARGGAAQHAAA